MDLCIIMPLNDVRRIQGLCYQQAQLSAENFRLTSFNMQRSVPIVSSCFYAIPIFLIPHSTIRRNLVKYRDHLLRVWLLAIVIYCLRLFIVAMATVVIGDMCVECITYHGHTHYYVGNCLRLFGCHCCCHGDGSDGWRVRSKYHGHTHYYCIRLQCW